MNSDNESKLSAERQWREAQRIHNRVDEGGRGKPHEWVNSWIVSIPKFKKANKTLRSKEKGKYIKRATRKATWMAARASYLKGKKFQKNGDLKNALKWFRRAETFRSKLPPKFNPKVKELIAELEYELANREQMQKFASNFPVVRRRHQARSRRRGGKRHKSRKKRRTRRRRRGRRKY